MDILCRGDGQSHGNQCVEEVDTIDADEGGGRRGAWAHGLEENDKVVRKLLDDGALVEEGYEDVVEPGNKVGIEEAYGASD